MMKDSIVEFFEKLITQFSWRRLFFVLTILFILVGSLITYETYTGHFRLKRIERATNLLNNLVSLSPKIKEAGDTKITKIFNGLVKDLNNYVNHRFTPFSLPAWLLKALAAAAPWLLFILISPLASDREIRQFILGVLFMAIPSIILGALLPDFRYPLLNYLAYPIVITALFFTAVVLWDKRKK